LYRVRRAASLEGLYREAGWRGERARCLLLLAEAALRQADEATCRARLDEGSAWILHSGSVEHLCLLHLIRARLGRRPDGDHAAAGRALEEGLHLARQSGLGLYLIDLLCEQAQAALAESDQVAAEAAAREAWLLARAPQCQFVWGETQAGHLLGQALAGQGR